MSSTSSGMSRGRDQSSDLGYQDALLIGSSIIGVLIALAVCRFCLYLFLDLCMSLDGGRRRRHVAEFLRKAFPFWNVRTEPAATEPNQQRSTGESNLENANSSHLSPENLTELLPTIVLSEDDIALWVTDNGSNKDIESGGDSDREEDKSDLDSTSFPCSICLNEMRAGEKVFKAEKCNHVFHIECLSQWVLISSNSVKIKIDCPNCRTSIHQLGDASSPRA